MLEVRKRPCRVGCNDPQASSRHSPFIRLSWWHVSGTCKPKDVCGHVQAMPPRHPCRRKRVFLSIHHSRLLPVWRTAAVPAVGAFSRQGGSPGVAPEKKAKIMFDPDAGMPRLNRGLVYLGACLIAGIRLARERQVNTRVLPTTVAIEESIDVAHEIFNRVFRKVPQKLPR